MTKITGSGSISQMHGSADPDPDPPQNVMDPQHWSKRCPFVAEEEAERYRAGAQLSEARPDMLAAADILEVAAHPEPSPDTIRSPLFLVILMIQIF
jgi:hypothetical protein